MEARTSIHSERRDSCGAPYVQDDLKVEAEFYGIDLDVALRDVMQRRLFMGPLGHT